MMHLVPMPEFTIPGNKLDVVRCRQCGFVGALAHDLLPADPSTPAVTADAGGELELTPPKPHPIEPPTLHVEAA